MTALEPNLCKAVARAVVAACVVSSVVAFAAGCQAPQDGSSAASTPANTAPARASSPGPKRLDVNSKPTPNSDPTAGLLSEGAEVDGNVGSNRLPSKARAAAQKPTTADTKAAAASALGAKGGWSILLASFSENNHRAMAEAARNSFAQRYPILRTAQVRTLSSGSTVVLGRYEGPKDPSAQAELKRVKEVGTGGERPFARAMLVRVTASAAAGPPSANDLRLVRRDRPEGTLYTLQVAAWAALGSKELTMEQIKRSAENYAQQLRTQGYEAYCYHDYDVETSIVSVGVFGHDAFDSKSTLYASEVEAVMRKFPKSLVNGEEVRVPVDPKSPHGKTVVQGPRLVEIPKF